MSSPSCSICFNIYVGSDNIVITPCGHMYHRNCLLQWFDESENRFSNGSTCPKCRKFCYRSDLQPVHLDFTETQYGSQANHTSKCKKKNKKGTNNENVNMSNSLQRCAPNSEPNSQPNSMWEDIWLDFYYTNFPLLLLMILLILLLIVILIKELYELIIAILSLGIFICFYIIYKSPH